MIETRSVDTEVGTIVISVYVCEFCGATTPVSNPGEGWVSVVMLKSDKGVVNSYHFDSLEHAVGQYNAQNAVIMETVKKK